MTPPVSASVPGVKGRRWTRRPRPPSSSDTLWSCALCSPCYKAPTLRRTGADLHATFLRPRPPDTHTFPLPTRPETQAAEAEGGVAWRSRRLLPSQTLLLAPGFPARETLGQGPGSPGQPTCKVSRSWGRCESGGWDWVRGRGRWESQERGFLRTLKCDQDHANEVRLHQTDRKAEANRRGPRGGPGLPWRRWLQWGGPVCQVGIRADPAVRSELTGRHCWEHKGSLCGRQCVPVRQAACAGRGWGPQLLHNWAETAPRRAKGQSLYRGVEVSPRRACAQSWPDRGPRPLTQADARRGSPEPGRARQHPGPAHSAVHGPRSQEEGLYVHAPIPAAPAPGAARTNGDVA